MTTPPCRKLFHTIARIAERRRVAPMGYHTTPRGVARHRIRCECTFNVDREWARTTGRLTHVEVVLVGIIEDFNKLDDVRVIEFLEYGDLAVDALEWVLYSRLAAEPRWQLLCTNTHTHTTVLRPSWILSGTTRESRQHAEK